MRSIRSNNSIDKKNGKINSVKASRHVQGSICEDKRPHLIAFQSNNRGFGEY